MDDPGYVELNVIIPSVDDEKREMVIALLAGVGYESFADTPSGINAYIQSCYFSKQSLADSGMPGLKALKGIEFSHRTIEKVNWNKEWESNFPQIMIAGRCSVRASFHPEPEKAEYDIVIDPKMSFGTGHHQTTALMAELMLDLPLENKSVMDAGCGTGILAILAAKKNASDVYAIDIDEWALRNTIENCIINGVNVTARQGDISTLKGEKYDVILANITRNFLIDNMTVLSASLRKNGFLLLSGFYSDDLKAITSEAEKENLLRETVLEKEGWCAVKFIKN